MAVADIRLGPAPFDIGAESAAFAARAAAAEGGGAGAVVTFSGLVRGGSGEARIDALEVEHYPGMSERALARIAQEAAERFGLLALLVIHRTGRLAAGEPIVMVATAAAHRGEAFAAAEFLMDWLKSRAPFWKKEIGPAGEAWVAARAGDEDALRRW